MLVGSFHGLDSFKLPLQVVQPIRSWQPAMAVDIKRYYLGTLSWQVRRHIAALHPPDATHRYPKS